ncbi:MAG TPA: HAD family phosphatase [Polyangiaceae bacterium]
MAVTSRSSGPSGSSGSSDSLSSVIFDLGGVVFDSPLALINEYEARHGLPTHFVARMVGGYGGPDGPWQRLECGDLSLSGFCERFDADAEALGVSLRTAELMREMHESAAVRPSMIDGIRKLRASGFKVAALTNNWEVGEDHDERMSPLRSEFDAFVESCKVRMRKPDPRIYLHACEALGIQPDAAVFLDDIGSNLKAAKALGMATIKVSDPAAALGELAALLGVDLGA